MPVAVQEIYDTLQKIAPPELACSWDNVGLLVNAGTPVTGVLTALDITPAVVREAVENDCELIVSHHPVIFDPLRRLDKDDVPAMLMQNGISAICMHTNLDAAPGGVNDMLSDVLGTDADTVMRPIEEDVDRQLLEAAIRILTPREKQIITMRFGLGGTREQTQKEVADQLGISQSYISRLEKRIISRLKKEILRLS